MSFRRRARAPGFSLSLHTALRKSEVLGLQWSDVDFTNRRIIIEKTKNGQTHVVLMDETLVGALAAARAKNVTDFVFPSYARDDKNHENMKSMRDVKRAFNTARAEVAKKYPAVASITFHTLRHVCATTLYNNGAEFSAIRAMLNHQSDKTTAIYLQVLDRSLREAADILERKLRDATQNWGTGGALEPGLPPFFYGSKSRGWIGGWS